MSIGQNQEEKVGEVGQKRDNPEKRVEGIGVGQIKRRRRGLDQVSLSKIEKEKGQHPERKEGRRRIKRVRNRSIESDLCHLINLHPYQAVVNKITVLLKQNKKNETIDSIDVAATAT